MASSEYLPDWIAGISIGAINAALIAGNRPDDRLKHLRAFWNEITSHIGWWPDGLSWPFAAWQRQASALMAVMYGQPGFFAPRQVYDWFSSNKGISYYDTSALKGTLERLVDFERINKAQDIRLSVGAVNVRTGQFSYFDSVKMPIRVEHIMASGALPPGFPPIEIDGEYYWDGGLYSNTPLEYVLDYSPRRSRLTFQVDVFHFSLRDGCLPISMKHRNAKRTSALRAGRRAAPMRRATSITSGTQSTSCTNCCRGKSRTLKKRRGSMSLAA